MKLKKTILPTVVGIGFMPLAPRGQAQTQEMADEH
jgi:hypothetical protein